MNHHILFSQRLFACRMWCAMSLLHCPRTQPGRCNMRNQKKQGYFLLCAMQIVSCICCRRGSSPCCQATQFVVTGSDLEAHTCVCNANHFCTWMAHAFRLGLSRTYLLSTYDDQGTGGGGGGGLILGRRRNTSQCNRAVSAKHPPTYSPLGRHKDASCMLSQAAATVCSGQ